VTRIFDRWMKPARWNWTYGGVEPSCRWALRELALGWPIWESQASSINLRLEDPIGRNHGVGPAASIRGVSGGSRGSLVTGVAGGDGIQVASSRLLRELASGIEAETVVIRYRRTDATDRTSGAWGVVTGTDDHRFGAHLPFSDGKVYFDVGKTPGAFNRLIYTGATFGEDVWVFVFLLGQRQEIWQNGTLLTSSTPTGGGRTTVDSEPFALFQHFGAKSDNAECSCFLLYKRALSDAEIRALTIDPWTPFRPMRRRAFIPVAGPTVSGPRARIPMLIGA
jgi:hypothetical protein